MRLLKSHFIFLCFNSEKEYPEIRRLFPDSRINHIPDAGHWVHAEKPLEFVELVTSFINQDKGDEDS